MQPHKEELAIRQRAVPMEERRIVADAVESVTEYVPSARMKKMEEERKYRDERQDHATARKRMKAMEEARIREAERKKEESHTSAPPCTPIRSEKEEAEKQRQVEPAFGDELTHKEYVPTRQAARDITDNQCNQSDTNEVAAEKRTKRHGFLEEDMPTHGNKRAFEVGGITLSRFGVTIKPVVDQARFRTILEKVEITNKQANGVIKPTKRSKSTNFGLIDLSTPPKSRRSMK
ncbi:hypothetical protein BLNAU_12341 [Blattamonas nauphoetae]|uniref:Uncharacterized protein n=1 Tax=Blattamonas nauphoetae TaxID=2049346 RepID=A0ABQ9XPZ0_9EUKA|nr:hypothetical protein BLNAU_12341 [Blattamonas nauphoetae]